MLGSVNVPGVSRAAVERRLEELLRSIMLGQVSLPLATGSGEILCTTSGVSICAVKKL